MNSIYIYHHLGLGDHIICNGLVRHFAEQYDRVFLFTKPVNVKNVLRMYEDNAQIKIIAMDDFEIRSFIEISPDNNYLIIGHDRFFQIMNSSENIKTFDEIFYDMAEIPPIYKWDKFYFKRDLEKERNAYYNILQLRDGENFIFIHESQERPVIKEIPRGIRQIRPDNKELSIYDFLYTIEKAKEVHVMNSSFMNLIDCIQLRNEGLFYHEYSRPNINAALKMNWKIIK